MRSEQRLLLVVSGPSGVGKDSIVNAMVQQHPGIEVSVSATTRAPREGERDGEHYHFLPRAQFLEYVRQDAFFEHTVYNGEHYGTLKREVDERIGAGTTCVLVIEVEGAANMKKLYPECTTVFIMPPSLEVLAQRLRGRGQESEEEVQRRIDVAKRVELPLADTYDYIIVNNDLQQSAEELYAILQRRQSEEA